MPRNAAHQTPPETPDELPSRPRRAGAFDEWTQPLAIPRDARPSLFIVVDTEEADLDRVLATNLKGVFFGCQSAARVMIEQGSGSIINMSSGAIDVPAETIVCYAMAKAAVAQLTKTLAVEVGPLGVRVNAVAPGLIVTGMTSRHFVS